ncbi:TetR/AcrR family transcriptional regulator [Pyruvatibacter mobilis]|uniref:TetR/AcrR family transcriptional regulator n=1 Tax=Pyruvatibacter mobilis TaxID=1712261 RepID=UPI003BA99117
MARPKPDEDEVRARLLAAADDLLRQHGADKLTVSDIAARCGMSQSNAYRFFASKKALLEALGMRWFDDIQAALRAVAAGGGTPEDRLRDFLLTQFTLKLERWRADPDLFCAYLRLADAHPAIAQAHIAENHDLLRRLVGDWCGSKGMSPRAATRVATQILDATLLIRDPFALARYGDDMTPRRARELVDLVLAGIQTR